MRTCASARLLATMVLLGACAGPAGGEYGGGGVEPGEIAVPEEDSGAAEVGPVADLTVDLTPSQSLMVRILSPSAMPSFSWSTGSMAKPFVPLGGMVVGDWDQLYLRTDYQDEPILVEPDAAGRFAAQVLLAPPLLSGEQLVAQTTTVWAVAHQGERRAYDVAVIVATPGFSFPRPLVVSPDVLFAGEVGELRFELDLGGVGGVDGSQVYLLEMDGSCRQKSGGSARPLVDNGDAKEAGDGLPMDGLYSARAKVDPGPAGMRWFRAAVTAKVGEQELVAFTGCTPVKVVPRLPVAACSGAKGILAAAQLDLDTALAAGWSLDEARQWAVARLQARESVVEAGADVQGEQVWALFAAGVLGVAAPTGPALSAGEQTLFGLDGTALAQRLPPASRQVVDLLEEEGGVGGWSALVKESACPPYRRLESKESMSGLRQMGEAGLLFLATRGGSAFGGLSDQSRLGLGHATADFDAPPPAWLGWEHAGEQQLVWSSTKVDCEGLVQEYRRCFRSADGKCLLDSGDPCPGGKECLYTQAEGGLPRGVLYDRDQADLMAGRLVLGADHLAFSPSFVGSYGRGAGQLVFLGIPQAMEPPVLAVEFLAGGANGVVGASGPTTPGGAEATGTALVSYLIAERVAVSEVVPLRGVSFADHSWRLLGAGNVDLGFSGLLNARFESGDLLGWQASGDARVLRGWCGESPAGKWMVALGTGAGLTPGGGRIAQEFCLTKEKLVFEGYYNFISHDFLENCGAPYYEDRFEMRIEDDLGQSVALAGTKAHGYVGLYDLCPCDAGECGECQECGSPACDCGVLYAPEGGLQPVLWPESCGFDLPELGEAFESGWRHTGEAALTTFGTEGLERPVRLVLSVSDGSGDFGKSVVLVDSLTLK